jgi:hypothetical protein
MPEVLGLLLFLLLWAVLLKVITGELGVQDWHVVVYWIAVTICLIGIAIAIRLRSTFHDIHLWKFPRAPQLCERGWFLPANIRWFRGRTHH